MKSISFYISISKELQYATCLILQYAICLIKASGRIERTLRQQQTVGGILTNLSECFDRVPHDLLLAKLAAYGMDDSLILYIHSYLSNRKHCVYINNVAYSKWT